MTIYGLGSNGSGQLGIGHNEDVSSPVPLALTEALKDQAIVNIASGGNHTLFLTDRGQVYSTGSNEDGRCALSDHVANTATLRSAKVSLHSTKVLLCAATWSASVFALDDGNLMSCGSGANGELGLGDGRVLAVNPQAILAIANDAASIAQLDASMAHVVAVLSDGSVLAWGNGRNGQIGEPAEVVWAPRRLNVPFSVVRAACGKDFTCLLGDAARGEIVLFGPNKRDRFNIKSSLPKSLDNLNQIVSSWGSVFVTENSGSLRAWGRNDRGQLGPENVGPISDIAAGSEHVLAKTTDGRVVVWGWGEHGNCGSRVDDQKDVKGRYNVLEVDGRVLMLGAGCATSFIVTDAG